MKSSAKTEKVSAKSTWPKDIRDQIRESIAARFKRKPVKSIEPVLLALETLGKVRRQNDL